MSRGASRVPLVLTVLALLVLVGVVAVASTGSTPSGTSEARPPADSLLDTFFSLALLAFIPAAALLVYGLMQRKEIAREMASGRYRRARLAAFLVWASLFAIAVLFRLSDWSVTFRGDDNEVVGVGQAEPAGVPDVGSRGETVYEPRFAWIPVIVVLVLAAAAFVAFVLAARRRRRMLNPLEEGVAEELADVLDDTLDDLRAEPDPRRAVIAAYARLERALAASGLPRWQAETAEEYVARILDRLEVDGAPVRTLTDLFTRAKFSQHDVNATMKEAAIEALVQIRDELREAARRRQEARELAPAAEEQAAPS